MVLFYLFEAVVEGNHSSLHLTDCTFSTIFELTHFFDLLVLSLAEKEHFLFDTTAQPTELFDSLDYFLIDSTLQLVELFDFGFVYVDDGFHLFDRAVRFKLCLLHLCCHPSNFVVLQLNVFRLFCSFSLQQEIMVFYLFVENGEGTFDFVNLDGVFCLLFVEGLEQFSHDFSNTRLYFVPLELSYLFGVLGGLLVIHVL